HDFEPHVAGVDAAGSPAKLTMQHCHDIAGDQIVLLARASRRKDLACEVFVLAGAATLKLEVFGLADVRLRLRDHAHILMRWTKRVDVDMIAGCTGEGKHGESKSARAALPPPRSPAYPRSNQFRGSTCAMYQLPPCLVSVTR